MVVMDATPLTTGWPTMLKLMATSPFLGTDLMEEPVTHGLPVINANHYAKKNSH